MPSSVMALTSGLQKVVDSLSSAISTAFERGVSSFSAAFGLGPPWRSEQLANWLSATCAMSDPAGVVRLIGSLGDVLRYVLESGGASARLADEFAIVERYLEIQRVRHSDRLAVSLTLAPEAAEASVPVLVVQPLVENALKHGLAPRLQAGSLTVIASVRDGRLRIDVEDDGVGLPEGWTMTASNGTGLRNLASRLEAEFGDQAALTVRPRQSGGVLASITLPFVRA